MIGSSANMYPTFGQRPPMVALKDNLLWRDILPYQLFDYLSRFTSVFVYMGSILVATELIKLGTTCPGTLLKG